MREKRGGGTGVGGWVGEGGEVGGGWMWETGVRGVREGYDGVLGRTTAYPSRTNT